MYVYTPSAHLYVMKLVWKSVTKTVALSSCVWFGLSLGGDRFPSRCSPILLPITLYSPDNAVFSKCDILIAWVSYNDCA